MRLRIAAGAALMVIMVFPGEHRVVADQRVARRSAVSSAPDCTDPGNYPASMAFVRLKNDGITDNDRVDFSKTTVTRLASERVSNRIFRQVHDVVFTEKPGRTLEVITVNNVSNDECAESQIEAYFVSKRLTVHPSFPLQVK